MRHKSDLNSTPKEAYHFGLTRADRDKGPTERERGKAGALVGGARRSLGRGIGTSSKEGEMECAFPSESVIQRAVTRAGQTLRHAR